MPRFSRCLAFLLLVLFVLPAALQAAEPRRDAAPVRNSAAQSSWVVLVQVWSFLTGVPLDNGCWIDPSGRCLAGQNAVATVDNGCRADPNGICLPGQSAVATVDNGCWIDPDGRCRQ